MDIDLNQFMGAYIDGSRENLDLMDKMLLALEQNPENKEATGEIFRAAHTLKGMSATMGYEKIAHLTHEMENILDLLRTGKRGVDSRVIDVLFETFDVLRSLVNDSISGGDSGIELTEILEKLKSLFDSSTQGQVSASVKTSESRTSNSSVPSNQPLSAFLQGIKDFEFSEYELGGLLEAQHRNLHTALLDVKLVADCLLKGPRVFMIIRALDGLKCEIVKSIPDQKDLENEKFDRSFQMIILSDKQTSEISDAVKEICEIEDCHVEFFSPESIKSGHHEASENAPSAAPPKPQVPEPPPQVSTPVPPPKPAQPTQQAQTRIRQQQMPQRPQTSTESLQPIAPPQQNFSQGAVASTASSAPVYGQRQQENVQPAQTPEAKELDLSKFQSKSPKKYEGIFSEMDEAKNRENHRETIELVQLVSFKMAGEIYAFDISQVEGIINLLPITRVPKAPSFIEGVINMRGEIVPVINLRHRLKIDRKQRVATDQIVILHFEAEKVKVGFLVDGVHEVIRLPQNSIEEPSKVSESVDVEYLSGVGKLHGKLIILLNARKVIFG
ncbi:MAG: chemotaxis protein CheW [Candidatus Riflebacteria bacterium]|nr:chemotaxis protein CheW [Candidatus Riflebacteria bacterium]